MNFERISIERAGFVARVTLERPELRNAFDDTTIAELTGAFRALGDDPTIRAIVLAARGAMFCAGADLNWMKRMADYSEAENRADALGLATMLHTIHTCAKPVVARVQGDAYAGGVGLIAACDIAVGVASAHFCLSEARIGLIPATIAPYVIRAIGARAAQRYFITAERFDATAAQRLGLLHEIVGTGPTARPDTPAEDHAALDAQLDSILQALVANGPAAVAASKRLVRDVAGAPLDETLIGDTVERIAQVRASPEGREGVRSFLDKRPPQWSGS